VIKWCKLSVQKQHNVWSATAVSIEHAAVQCVTISVVNVAFTVVRWTLISSLSRIGVMVARRGNPSEVDREVSYNADTIATIQ